MYEVILEAISELKEVNVLKTISRAFDVLKRLKKTVPKEYQEALDYVDNVNKTKKRGEHEQEHERND